jgi:hypothetical protein
MIENWWSVIKVSAVTWVAQILGWATVFYAYVNTSSDQVKAVLHFSAWGDWLMWVVGLAVAFGLPVARGIAQKSVQAAASK